MFEGSDAWLINDYVTENVLSFEHTYDNSRIGSAR